MRKSTFLRAALGLAATMMVFAFTAGSQKAYAQGGKPCDPCPTWWVETDYVFPPCALSVPVDVLWANGQWSNDVETTDGHHIYATPPPISPAVQVNVLGVPVPINGGPVWIPYACTTPPNPPMPGMCLKVEIVCNPCLQIKLHLEPCP